MNKKMLFALWGVLFGLCAGLGFIPGFSGQVSTGVQAGLTLLSVGCFVPPFLLAYGAGQTGDRKTLKLLRNLAALSLGLTLVVLLTSMACAMAADAVGVFLHVLLILVSSPMVCSGYWVLSLFLWACLMMWSISLLKKNP